MLVRSLSSFRFFENALSDANFPSKVFGRLVGGDDVLSKIERVPVDPATNRPRKPVMVKDISVFQDPFDDYRQKLEKRLKREEEDRVGAVAKAKKKEEREKDRTTSVLPSLMFIFVSVGFLTLHVFVLL